jgi:hypothetical protein
MIYEVGTVYLPAEKIVTILDSNPHYRFPRMINPGFLPHETGDLTGAGLTQVMALVSGEVEFTGRRCRRITWLMNWKLTGEEEVYKSTVCYSKKNTEGPRGPILV